MTRVPELRFAGFSGEWEENIFDNLAEYKKGPFGSALKKSIFVPKSKETVKVYEQQNAIEKDWELERYFITRDYADKMENFNVGPGDLIVSCAGTIGEMYELPNCAEKGIINQALMRIRVKNSIDKRFFNHIFDKMIKKSSARLSNGSAIKNIPPFSDLKPHKTYIPSYNEQEKIGDLFSKIDQLIESQQELVDQTKALKKSMLQKMFPKKDSLVPEFRFDGFIKNWCKNTLGKTYKVTMGQSPNSKNYTNDNQHMVLVQGNADLKHGKVYPRIYTTEITKIAKANSILMTVRAPVGKLAINKCEVVIGRGVCSIEGNYFLYYLLENLNENYFWYKFTSGSTFESINSYDIKNAVIKSPSLEEQEKIGNFFKKLDEKIAREEKLLDAYKDMKKSLLQKMFV